jgi:hypothetical protein
MRGDQIRGQIRKDQIRGEIREDQIRHQIRGDWLVRSKLNVGYLLNQNS